jgi:hypothetical protein
MEEPMSREQQTKRILKNIRFELPSTFKKAIIGLLILGVLGVALGLFSWHLEYIGTAILINCVFWVGISLAGITFSSIFTITDAFWGRPIKRLAESLSSFLPIGIALFLVLFFFGNLFFEWYDHDKVIHSKEWWLNIPFFVGRNIFLFLLVLVFIYFYLKNSIRPDIILAKKVKFPFDNALARHFAKNAADSETEIAAGYQKNRRITPLLVIVITLVTSVIAFDWIMSIDQEWFSTMFGVQYFVSSMIAAGAFLMILIGFLREKFQLQDYISLNRYHDLAKLTFAFTVGWTYMVFAQVLVIWYANLPEETPYLVLRMKSEEWGWMFWLLFVMIFIVTFFGLMSRTACRSIKFSRVIAIILLAGLWLEKYFLITPSLQENALGLHHANAGAKVAGFEFLPFLIDILITLGFLGVFLYGIFLFIQKIPMVPISDYRFFSDNHH